jgi:thioredoxin 1
MLDLGSKSCVPCKKMAPILDSLELLYEGRAEIEFIDVKEDKEALRRYGITLIPTQIFYDSSGKEVYRHIGFFPADSITAHFKELGVSL